MVFDGGFVLMCAFLSAALTFAFQNISTMNKLIALLSFIQQLAFVGPSVAQPEVKTKKNHSFYFSWGYNQEWYTKSNVHVKQEELGNDYTLNQVDAHNRPGWNTGIFNKAISIPQYNYRLGYMFNEEKGWGVEINFDHTKYIITEPQNVHITGTHNHQSVDTTVNFQESNGFYYYLNNGANFLLFNFVKRWHVMADKKHHFAIDGFGKFGVGPLIPHVENMLWGVENNPHFQIGGWNTGLEGALRVTYRNLVYLEYANKLDYARYSGMTINNGGKINQAFGTYEMILSLGVNISKK